MKENKFLKLKFLKTTEIREKPYVRTSIEGQLKRLILTYKKIYMKKFKELFTFSNLNNSIKNVSNWEYMKSNEEKPPEIESEEI